MSNYSEEQIANILKIYPSVEEMERQTAIRNARQYLKDTDYIVIKIQEYSILGRDIDNDYAEVMKKREYCREILRKLEV